MTGMWLVAIFLTTSVRVTDAGSGNEWGYEGNTGPSTWHIDYPQCSGKSQSPISVDTSKAVLNTNLTSFDLQGYDTASNVNMSLKNNGHSVQVDLTGNTMFVRGGGLPNSFRAKQFHFHWGSEDKRGSEHDINGRHFPMEMHVVHYNTKYSSYNEASNKTNGLLVLAFLFEVGTANANFEHIIRHFYQIAHKADHVNLETFPLRALFPDDLDVYYRYHGSLTTPPCAESVIWTIFKQTIKISEDQLMKFRHNVHRNYANETDRDISDDYRPAQPLNHRVVYASDSLAIYQAPSSNTITIYICRHVFFLCLCFLLLYK